MYNLHCTYNLISSHTTSCSMTQHGTPIPITYTRCALPHRPLTTSPLLGCSLHHRCKVIIACAHNDGPRLQAGDRLPTLDDHLRK